MNGCKLTANEYDREERLFAQSAFRYVLDVGGGLWMNVVIVGESDGKHDGLGLRFGVAFCEKPLPFALVNAVL